jgi:hypothetical protein
MSTTGVPGGLPSHDYSHVPDKVYRRRVGRTPHARRSCRDNRPYVVVPWTLPGAVTTGEHPPYWIADRDYWIAGCHATVDTPSSSGDIQINAHVTRRGTGDIGNIMTSDTRLRIEPDENEDSLDEARDGIMEESDLHIKRLKRGDRVHVEIVADGTGAEHLVFVLELVPYPWPEREFERIT